MTTALPAIRHSRFLRLGALGTGVQMLTGLLVLHGMASA